MSWLETIGFIVIIILCLYFFGVLPTACLAIGYFAGANRTAYGGGAEDVRVSRSSDLNPKAARIITAVKKELADLTDNSEFLSRMMNLPSANFATHVRKLLEYAKDRKLCTESICAPKIARIKSLLDSLG